MSFLKRRARQEAEPEPRHEDSPRSWEEASRDNIGPLLRQTRESFGYDLQQISQVLRIRYLYLEAIEQGNFDRLPGPAYTVGFIRSYADFLGLDSAQIIDFYKRDVSTPRSEQSLYFPEPVSEAKMPGAAVFTICLVLAAVAYGSWYYASESKSSVADLVPEVPDRLKVLLEPKDTEVAEAIARATEEEQPIPPPDRESGASEAAARAAEPLPEAAEAQPSEEGLSTEEAAEADPEGAAEVPVEAPAEALEGAAEALEGAAEPLEGPVEAGDAESADDALEPQSEDEISALIEEMVGEADASEAAAGESATGTAADAGGTALVDDADPHAEISDGTQLAEIPAIPESASEAGPDLAPDPQVYGDEGVEVRIVLRATHDSWVQVREESGNLLLSRVLRPGDVYRVPNEENLTLLAGNAGGLEVLVDGRLLPSLGPMGVVRRDIALNAEALLGGTANVQ